MLRSRECNPETRGQALVETALVLPLLIVLLLFAVDFGRVFFGYIGVQNLSRIGANYAATHAMETDWGPGSPYHELVLRDAEIINCEDPVSVDPPVFAPSPPDLGGDASTRVTCDFMPINPLVRALVGTPLSFSAVSTFPVRSGCPACDDPAGAPLPPPPQPPTCNRPPSMIGLSVAGAKNEWGWAGFSGSYTAISYPNGLPAAPADDVRTVLTATVNQPADADGCVPSWANVVVTFAELPPQPDPACPSGTYVPNLLSRSIGKASTAWSGAGFTGVLTPDPAGGEPNIVTGLVVSPDNVPIDGCADPASAGVVTWKPKPQPQKQYCKVPDFHGTSSEEAETTWAAAGFSAPVSFLGTRPYTIGYQSLPNGWEPCSSGITVGPGTGSP